MCVSGHLVNIVTYHSCKQMDEKSWLFPLLQLQDSYSKGGIACLTGEEIGNSIQNLELVESEDREADPCWQVKWHLGKLIKKVFGKSLLGVVTAEGILIAE